MQNIVHEEEFKVIQPFLRWAGGKRWFVKHINDFLPLKFNNYHEPFLGGASVFLYLKNNGKIKHHAFLSDFNEDLINTYKQIQLSYKEIISYLEGYKNEKDDYYRIRSLTPQNDIEKAAIFIFLNRTSYNGIYRVNSNGQYNVPFGYRKGKTILENSDFSYLHNLFNKNIKFDVGDFDIIKQNIGKGDLVFLDPPYTVAHENNGFIQYNQQIFSWEDQERLAKLLTYISKQKAYFILTNAAHESIKELFGNLGNLTVIQRPSTIGGKGAKRTLVNEYIFSNIKKD